MGLGNKAASSQDVMDVAKEIVNKYKIGLEWDDFDQSELFLVDKKAGIRASLKILHSVKHLV